MELDCRLENNGEPACFATSGLVQGVISEQIMLVAYLDTSARRWVNSAKVRRVGCVGRSKVVHVAQEHMNKDAVLKAQSMLLQLWMAQVAW